MADARTARRTFTPEEWHRPRPLTELAATLGRSASTLRWHVHRGTLARRSYAGQNFVTYADLHAFFATVPTMRPAWWPLEGPPPAPARPLSIPLD